MYRMHYRVDPSLHVKSWQCLTNYTHVWHVTVPGPQQVFVWKEIDYGGMTEKEKQLLVQEVNLLRELRHPNIVRYHDRIIARTEATLYIIMEHCQGGDLAAIIAKCRTERYHSPQPFPLSPLY